MLARHDDASGRPDRLRARLPWPLAGPGTVGRASNINLRRARLATRDVANMAEARRAHRTAKNDQPSLDVSLSSIAPRGGVRGLDQSRA